MVWEEGRRKAPSYPMCARHGAFVRKHELTGGGQPIGDLEVEDLYGPW